MAAGPNVEGLLQKLDQQHQAYTQTFRELYEALSQIPATTSPLAASSVSAIASTSTSKKRRLLTQTIVAKRPERLADDKSVAYHSSVLTGESDESDSDEEYYVQVPLPSYQFDHEDLRHHLETYEFNEHGKRLLKTVIAKDGRLHNPSLFPDYAEDKLWHNSHYSVFDVGKDGALLSRSEVVKKGTTKIDSAIWQAIQNLNSNPDSPLRTVGRITIVREPSPIILGALHLTMNKVFDMDELFGYLEKGDTSSAYMLQRNFSHDTRIRRSFAFKFDYFTIVGDDVAPMPWQQSDTPGETQNRPHGHIPISRCSSVMALSLTGESVKRLGNANKKANQQHIEDGFVYDLWAPWHVLNIQCYPDHKHSMDSHDSTKHYVNGPEAFLHTLLAEFKDAERRFEDIYKKISKIITPPAEFMFNENFRDKLLLEEDYLNYSRRYFWSYQTLGLMRDSIKAIIDAYEDTFTDDVWEGKHQTLWPMIDAESSRNKHWCNRMSKLKKEFERIIKDLYKLHDKNNERRKEIRTLRDQLFSESSVQKSQRSVELNTAIFLQEHNIKLFTLVSIFFLPLTFVTSLFAMGDIPSHRFFKWFTVGTLFIPFFLMIVVLNTTSDMKFWRNWRQSLKWAMGLLNKNHKDECNNGSDHSETAPMQRKQRSPSTSEAIRERNAQLVPRHGSTVSTAVVRTGRANSLASQTQPQVENDIGAAPVSDPESSNSTPPKRATLSTTPISSTKKGTVQEVKPSWWEKLTGGRNKRDSPESKAGSQSESSGTHQVEESQKLQANKPSVEYDSASDCDGSSEDKSDLLDTKTIIALEYTDTLRSIIRQPGSITKLRDNFQSWIDSGRSKLQSQTRMIEKAKQQPGTVFIYRDDLVDFISDLIFIPREHLVTAYYIRQPSISLLDKIKAKIEGHTQESWDWWPLQASKTPVPHSMDKLGWTCVSNFYIYTKPFASASTNPSLQKCGHTRTTTVLKSQIQEYLNQLQRHARRELVGDVKRDDKVEKMRRHGSNVLRGIPGLVDDPNVQFKSPSASRNHGSEVLVSKIKPHNLPSSSSAVQPSIPTQAHFRNQGDGTAESGSKIQLAQTLLRPDKSESVQTTLNGTSKSTGNTICMPLEEYVLLGINIGYSLQLCQIDRSVCPDDGQFFAKLKKEYNTTRGMFRRWIGVRQFHHCEFVEFEKPCYKKIIRRGRGYPHDVPHLSVLYRYKPTDRQPQWKDPPILPYEFYDRYYGCSNCMVLGDRFSHRCSHFCPATIERVERIPKRTVPLELEAQGQEEAWGLHAVEYISAVRVVLYHVLMLIGPSVFWCLWLWYWGHRADLQNASVPIVCMVPLLSMFWALLKGDELSTVK